MTKTTKYQLVIRKIGRRHYRWHAIPFPYISKSYQNLPSKGFWLTDAIGDGFYRGSDKNVVRDVIKQIDVGFEYVPTDNNIVYGKVPKPTPAASAELIANIRAATDKVVENKPKEPELETVHDTMPIMAHRAALLVPARGGLVFGSVTANKGSFEVDATAECLCTYINEDGISKKCRHSTVPATHGLCGFYGVPSDIAAQHSTTTVTLLVAFTGRVIEHEYGYRAQYQRVLEIHLPHCYYCRSSSTIAHFNKAEVFAFTCEDHANISSDLVKVTRDQLASNFGIKVTDEQPKSSI